MSATLPSPPSPLSAAELRHVLAGYGLRPHDDDPPRVVTARVIHLAQIGGGIGLKVFPAKERAEAEIESSLLAHLGGAGDDDHYRVQQLLRTTAGDVLLPLHDRRVLATRWEPGFHRAYHEIDAPGWTTLGRTLAALHQRLDSAPRLPLRRALDELRRRDLDHDRHTLADHRARVHACDRPDAPRLLRMLDDRTTLLERHATRCLATLAALPTTRERPIHNDFNVHNYLFHASGPPTILDWERAVLAPRELEVCRCLAHLPLVAPARAWAFVDGYLARGTLDPELVPWALDAVVTLHALKHWPVEPWLAAAPGSAERIPGMAEIVRAFVEGRARLESFAHDLRARIRERAP